MSPLVTSRLRSLAPSIVLASLAAGSAGARTVVLEPQGASAPVAIGSWTMTQRDDGAQALTAPDHPLRPTIAPDGTFEVTVESAGLVRFTPLGSWGGPTTKRVELPRLPAKPEQDGLLPDRVLLRGSLFGVDELFVLRAGAVEHDLLVHEEAVELLGAGDLRSDWAVELPRGTRLGLEKGDAVLRDAKGAFLARVPAPRVADADDPHWSDGVSRLELARRERSLVLSMVTPGSWLNDPERAFPLRLDPTFSLQPTDITRTGFVDERGFRREGPMVSGTLLQIGLGGDVRAFAEFDTSSIPDNAQISEVRLQVWISNHDNPGNPAVPLYTEVKHVPTSVDVPNLVLHAAIPGLGLGTTYASEDVPRTGPEFCPDAYVFRDYDLGSEADSNLQSQLPLDFFTIGFVTVIVDDPFFDHVDQIGYPEEVDNPFTCQNTDFPGTRITLVVEFASNAPPQCDAGGPYLSDCPSDPIALDGSGSSDSDGQALTYAWSVGTCSGSISNADQAMATLQLDPSCAETCLVELTVSDGTLSSTCTAQVVAADTDPPVVTDNRLEGVCLWPPRHDLFCLTDPASMLTVEDACQGVTVRFLGCASDQPDEAPEEGRPENGDGHFPNDCQVSSDGQQLCVRVERAGNDPEGRHYVFLVEVTDGCNGATVVAGSAFVPHDRRGGSGGQADPCRRGSRRR